MRWYFWTHQLLEVTRPDVVSLLDSLYIGNIASLAVDRDHYDCVITEKNWLA